MRQPRALSIMVQGTGSGVGKSVIVAGLCRLFHRMGFRVAPFKAQNMALNSYVTIDGGEIGRAQAVQALASGLEPTVDMNPILIKPTADTTAQVIVHGRPVGNFSAVSYHDRKPAMLKAVEESYGRLAAEFDLIIIEGAGSPAEVNLKENDIVNMRIAKLAEAVVLLVGDIDKGGVFASLLGTLELLEDDERDMVKGFIINKFRGDRSLLDPGLRFLKEKTGVPVLGVVPHIRVVIEEEDAVKDGLWSTGGEIDLVVLGLPHISNFTDFNALALEKSVSVRIVRSVSELGWPDAVIVPGTKNTLSDLAFLEKTGLVGAVRALAASGRPVIGVCGGYQMLGREVEDPEGVESNLGVAQGLGLLDARTILMPTKATRRTKLISTGFGPILDGVEGELAGYEIHVGRTTLGAGARPAFEVVSGEDGVFDGAVDPSGLIIGTYLHGIFDNTNFRKSFIDYLRKKKGLAVLESELDYARFIESEMDVLAGVLSEHLDLRYICEKAGLDAARVGSLK